MKTHSHHTTLEAARAALEQLRRHLEEDGAAYAAECGHAGPRWTCSADELTDTLGGGDRYAIEDTGAGYAITHRLPYRSTAPRWVELQDKRGIPLGCVNTATGERRPFWAELPAGEYATGRAVCPGADIELACFNAAGHGARFGPRWHEQATADQRAEVRGYVETLTLPTL